MAGIAPLFPRGDRPYSDVLVSRASDQKVESSFWIIPMLNQSGRASFVRPNGRTAL